MFFCVFLHVFSCISLQLNKAWHLGPRALRSLRGDGAAPERPRKRPIAWLYIFHYTNIYIYIKYVHIYIMYTMFWIDLYTVTRYRCMPAKLRIDNVFAMIYMYTVYIHDSGFII